MHSCRYSTIRYLPSCPPTSHQHRPLPHLQTAPPQRPNAHTAWAGADYLHPLPTRRLPIGLKSSSREFIYISQACVRRPQCRPVLLFTILRTHSLHLFPWNVFGPPVVLPIPGNACRESNGYRASFTASARRHRSSTPSLSMTTVRLPHSTRRHTLTRTPHCCRARSTVRAARRLAASRPRPATPSTPPRSPCACQSEVA